MTPAHAQSRGPSASATFAGAWPYVSTRGSSKTAKSADRCSSWRTGAPRRRLCRRSPTGRGGPDAGVRNVMIKSFCVVSLCPPLIPAARRVSVCSIPLFITRQRKGTDTALVQLVHAGRVPLDVHSGQEAFDAVAFGLVLFHCITFNVCYQPANQRLLIFAYIID